MDCYASFFVWRIALLLRWEKQDNPVLCCFCTSSFSFLYPVLLLLLNRVVPKRLLFLFLVLFVSSNLVEELNLSAIATSFEQFLPDSFVSRNDMYLNLEMQDHNWFSQSYRFVWKYINFFLAIYIYTLQKEF